MITSTCRMIGEGDIVSTEFANDAQSCNANNIHIVNGISPGVGSKGVER